MQRHTLGESTYLKFSSRVVRVLSDARWPYLGLAGAGWGAGGHTGCLLSTTPSPTHWRIVRFTICQLHLHRGLGERKQMDDMPRQDNLSSVPYLHLGFIPSQRVSCDNTAAQEALKGSFKSCTPSPISLPEKKWYLSKHEKRPLALGERKESSFEGGMKLWNVPLCCSFSNLAISGDLEVCRQAIEIIDSVMEKMPYLPQVTRQCSLSALWSSIFKRAVIITSKVVFWTAWFNQFANLVIWQERNLWFSL